MNEPAASMASNTELRLGQAVLTAAGLDGAERETYLRGLAAADSSLAAEARRRIAAAEGLSDSFLATPAAARLAGDAAEPEEPAPGAALPAGERYELGKCLGEGGMGRVVLAFDRQLGRSVALKFLTHENPEVLRLFLGEARAQARVEHEHVLEIYDSGEIDGQPFIAMRYVAGGTLADVGASLSLEHKVRLLAQVAEGLHAAHREGLLHRDVKPSNVLVDQTPDGELKALVTDFGLATEVGDAESMAAAVAGSPHYIAPERLSGSPAAVDRRSDVYSLGITLYRLFTGDVPFTGQNTVDVLRQALHEDLPPPRQRLPTLPVELEAIILRCTARDPGQRYASARAVAADLQRYLDGEVVEAYAASLAYRLTRFVLRNKLLAGMATAAVAISLVASVAVTVFALRADAARERAEMRQGQAEGLIRFMLGDLRKTLEPLGQLDVMTAIGDQAMRYFSSVPPSELSAEELFQRSEALNQIAYIRLSRAEYDKALTAYQESLTLARGLVKLDPENVEWQKRLAAGHFFVGKVFWEQGDRAHALVSFEAQLEVARRLAERHPQDTAVQLELANALTNIGFVHRAMADLDRAVDAFGDALKILERAIVQKPEETDLRYEYANKTALVGDLLWQLGEPGAALERFVAAQEIMDRLVGQDPSNSYWQERLAITHMRIGDGHRAAGEQEAARRHVLAFFEMAEHLVAIEPKRAQWRQDLAVAHRLAGDDLRQRGAPEAALEHVLQGVKILEELVETSPTPVRQRLLAGAYVSMGEVLVRIGDRTGAERQARQALARLEPLAQQDPGNREMYRQLVAALLLLGQTQTNPERARAVWSRAASVFEPFARDSKDLDYLTLWHQVLELLGRRQEAAAVESRLAELRRQVIAAHARLHGGSRCRPPMSPFGGHLRWWG